ncbi:MAG: prephenate dehydrogenase/arogenate dehydrogenase family protein [Verrucomicrobiae bacterium]|nr:prephenate dehydrogenase/arogenate dehydrogenase family protein [Verrucomicrobiae bacterium]
MPLKKLTVLGPGLLGGSIGLAARARALAERVVLWARRPEACDDAMKFGAADAATLKIEEAVGDADLVVLATPIGVMGDLTAKMAPHLRPQTVVTDVGSVKYPVVTQISHLLEGKARFVGSHPMAGSEQAGISAASKDLFEGRVCILTPVEQTDPDALRQTADFWKSLGAVVRTLPPLEHDEIVAQVSHLPHLVAAALMNHICANGPRPLEFAGGGLRDTTRIASGPPTMWQEICVTNRDEVCRALEGLIEQLEAVRRMLHNKEDANLTAFLKRAKHFRDEMNFRK